MVNILDGLETNKISYNISNLRHVRKVKCVHSSIQTKKMEKYLKDWLQNRIQNPIKYL